MSNNPPNLETIEITLPAPGVAVISHNRPERYNALSPLVYKEWLTAIRWAAQATEVRVTILTGKGKYYTSGQELRVPDSISEEDDLRAILTRNSEPTKDFVKELILFPKLLIAAVNGPAIGFGVTTLALCDIVYSVPEATFNTPFMQLAFCAEGCSSYLFPRIMGRSRANEMLLLGRKFTASEMSEYGFISRLIPADGFINQVIKIAADAAALPNEALRQTRELLRKAESDVLLKVNDEEMTLLIDRMLSEEAGEAMMKFLAAQETKKAARKTANKL